MLIHLGLLNSCEFPPPRLHAITRLDPANGSISCDSSFFKLSANDTPILLIIYIIQAVFRAFTSEQWLPNLACLMISSRIVQTNEYQGSLSQAMNGESHSQPTSTKGRTFWVLNIAHLIV